MVDGRDQGSQNDSFTLNSFHSNTIPPTIVIHHCLCSPLQTYSHLPFNIHLVRLKTRQPPLVFAVDPRGEKKGDRQTLGKPYEEVIGQAVVLPAEDEKGKRKKEQQQREAQEKESEATQELKRKEVEDRKEHECEKDRGAAFGTMKRF